MIKFGKRILFVLLAVLAMALETWASVPSELVPVGRTVGIELKTGQVTVIGFSDTVHAAQEAGLRKGDVLETINGTAIHDVDQITPILSGSPVRVTVLRSGRRQEYLLEPKQNNGSWCLGILVQDTMTGIGTVTYYDPATCEYGALGHGVSERTGEVPIPMESGQVVPSSVVNVEKSSRGKPGALRGALEQVRIGSVERNTNAGIFGVMEPMADCEELLPVATAGQVECGDACILSNVSGTETARYSVVIEHVDAEDDRGRNLLLHVTDPALLEQTGGIVQGM